VIREPSRAGPAHRSTCSTLTGRRENRLLEHRSVAAVLVVILAGALAADTVWAARGGRGGHSGGKRGGAAHAGAPSAGGARAPAHGKAGGGRAAAASPASMHAAGAPAGSAHAGGGRTVIIRGGGGLFALGAFHRADGRYFGHPPQRTGTLVGLAALWQYPPPGYPAPAVVVPYIPSEYIEMGPGEQPVVVPPQGYWYFCPDESGYYPHVDDCPGGWELVAPPGGVPPPG